MSDLFDLSGRLALVTGAGGRLGRAMADALADAGAEILLTGRDEEGVRATAAALGPAALGIHPADLREEAAIQGLFAEIKEHHGGLDVLVNNAGIARQARFGEVTAEDFAAVLAVNVTATFLCAQHAAPLMRARSAGKIVNVGSIYGSVAVDSRIYEDAPGMVESSPPYAASKSALVNLTRDLAVRLAPWNIQVNLRLARGCRVRPAAPLSRELCAADAGGADGASRRHCGDRDLPGGAGIGLRHRAEHPGRRRADRLVRP